tara:strand:+ start:70 stop:252 length:183 start_codon:yes stop_codon:yes gene_type:complete
MDNNNQTNKKEEDTWGKIMRDLYQFGKDTNSEDIIKQAVKGQMILNDQKRTVDWLKKSSN